MEKIVDVNHSGKTTLMHTIREELMSHTYSPPIHTIWFDAWRYDREDDLLIPFFLTINNQLSENEETKNIKKQLLTSTQALLRGFKFNLGLFEFSAKDAIEAENKLLNNINETYTNIFINIEKQLKNLTYSPKDNSIKNKYVIFIDDLDRCLPKKSLALLESIKTFLDITGFIFVLGLDPRIIDYYLSTKYGDTFCITANEYLEKMIQIPFNIPPVSKIKLKDELFKLAKDFDASLVEIIMEASNYFPLNLRKIKRILNNFPIILSLSDEIDPKLLLVMLVLQAKWPTIYLSIWKYHEEFLESIYNLDDNIELNLDSKVSEAAKEAYHEEEFKHFFQEIMRPTLASKNNLEKIVSYLNYMGLSIEN